MIGKKGRIRTQRGFLQNFTDLPESKQIIFTNIKKFIDEISGYDTEINIFGSFYNGDWDENSDYDIFLQEKIDGVNKKIISELVGVKVDIFINKRLTIRIPKINF